jgi:hypothetical protein
MNKTNFQTEINTFANRSQLQPGSTFTFIRITWFYPALVTL